MEQTTVSQRYRKLSLKRGQYIRIAEKCSEFTLPYLFPKRKSSGKDGNIAQLDIQYTSAGAEAVNFLANRLVSVLYPPNKPFFRAKVPEEILQKQSAPKADVEKVIANIEKVSVDKFNAIVAREHLLAACLNLIVGGNVCLLQQASGSRYFPLYNYVVKRAASDGKLLRLIIKEVLEIEAVPTEYVKNIPAEKLTQCQNDSNTSIDLYTESVWSERDKSYVVTQYFDDTPVLQNTYAEDEFPYMVLTWNLLSGEHYGHSYCEDYLGSITSVGVLAEGITQLCQVISKIINLVDPSSPLAFQLDELTRANSGDFFVGKKDDITQMVSNKLSDMQALLSNYDMHSSTIKRVFLQNSSVQRDAERVTAAEIQQMAKELETAQGGIYAHLANTWQKKAAKLIMIDTLNALGADAANLAKSLDIKILTGIESLSRTAESDSILTYLNQLSVFNNVPEAALAEISMERTIRALAMNSDMQAPSDLLLSAEEKAARQQQTQQQQAAAMMAE